MINHNLELQNRLKNLQHDIENGNTGWFANNLKAIDVILLLKLDPNIRQIVREIMQEESKDMSPNRQVPQHNVSQLNPSVRSTQQYSQNNSILQQNVQPIKQPETKPDPLRTGLADVLELLKKVKKDEEISKYWLSNAVGEADELITLIVKIGNYDELIRLHGWLKDRCKARKTAITLDEKYILETALKVHNKNYNSKKAELNYPSNDDKFDYKVHERINATGETVQECILPALVNPSGSIDKNKSLVLTK